MTSGFELDSDLAEAFYNSDRGKQIACELLDLVTGSRRGVSVRTARRQINASHIEIILARDALADRGLVTCRGFRKRLISLP